jgi:uncharacterized protein YjbJ (UPF0337 family)
VNGNPVEDDWRQDTGKVKEAAGDITDIDLDPIAGKRDVLIGKTSRRMMEQRGNTDIQNKVWR